MRSVEASEPHDQLAQLSLVETPDLRRYLDAVCPLHCARAECHDVAGAHGAASDALPSQWRRGAFYDPKTKASRRTIELPDEAISALKRWRLRCPKGEHDLVCPNPKGKPQQASDVLRSGLHPTLRRAGIR